MGPSVKFVSRMNGLFSKKLLRVNFFSRKKDQTGGLGSEGSLAKDEIYYVFMEPLPKLGPNTVDHLQGVIMRIENCFAKAILLIEILGEAFLTQKELFCYVLV